MMAAMRLPRRAERGIVDGTIGGAIGISLPADR
jgi:hypothetical protein